MEIHFHTLNSPYLKGNKYVTTDLNPLASALLGQEFEPHSVFHLFSIHNVRVFICIYEVSSCLCCLLL